MIQFLRTADKDHPLIVSEVQFAMEHNISLPDILEEFECFLKACGYVLPGTLDFIEEDIVA